MVEVPGYRIRHLLDWGAQGDVFLAVDGNEQKVALKVVAHDRAGVDLQGAERLRREGRLLAAIRSPHVVAVRAFVETDELSCLVLEFLEGERLDALVRERAGLPPSATHDPDSATVKLGPAGAGPLAAGSRAVAVPTTFCTQEHVAWALPLAIQLVRGVAELHSINLLHRDLKPENAMVVDGRVVLIDFGLARAEGMTTMTQSGAIVGSLAYMSPEQFHGAAATKRSDVYSLGATIYSLLVGSPPHADSGGGLVALAEQRRAKTVNWLNSAVPANLTAVLARAMEPDPRDRHPDAEAVLADLERCERGEAVAIPFSSARWWRRHRRRLRWMLAAAALLLCTWLLWPDPAAERRTETLVRALQTDPKEAARLWQAYSPEEQQPLLAELNRRLGDDVEIAIAAARTLQLGLLRVRGRTNHLAVLIGCEPDAVPVVPAIDGFLPVDRPRCFLAPPGRAWFLLLSKERRFWWSPDDPRCLQLAVQVTVPGADAPVVERTIDALPTESIGASVPTGWASVAAGEHPLRGPGGESRTTQIVGDFVADVLELDQNRLFNLRLNLHAARASRAELDGWLRHPNEPVDVADTLWALWQARSSAKSEQPAQVTFWEAWRLAAAAGCRLPTTGEWLVVSRNAGMSIGTKEQRLIPDALLPVDGETSWDCTDAGVRFANSNVLEWVGCWRTREPRECKALPTTERRGGRDAVPRFNDSPMAAWNAAATDPFGVRFYRSVIKL